MLELAQLLASVLLASSLPSAQVVDSVTPASGAYGSQLVIAGSGFGDKKARAFLVSEDDGKTRKLKVLEWTDTEILVELRKLPAGMHELDVQLKGKGMLPVAAPEAVLVELPSDAQFSPDTAGPGQEVTLTAQGLGTKKGSIKVGGVKAKVLSWVGVAPTDGEGAGMVVFKLGKKTPAGLQSVSVKTTAGEAVLETTLEVTAPVPGGGGPGIPGNPFSIDAPGLSFLIDGAPTAMPFTAPDKTAAAAATTNTKVRSTSDNGFTSMELRLDYDAPASETHVAMVTPPAVHIIYTTLSAIYSTTADPQVGAVLAGASATTTYTGLAFTPFPEHKNAFGGSFSATLVKVEGTGPDTIAITQGFFFTKPSF